MPRSRRPRLALPVALGLFTAAACENQPPAAQVPQPAASSGGYAPPSATSGAPSATMAHVRAIHASPDPLAATVVVYLDGATTPVIPNLGYRTAVGYADIAPGQHAVQVRLPGIPATTPPQLSWTTQVLQPDHTYTIVAVGLALEAPAVTFVSDEDTATMADAGHANIRFFHALVGGPAYDLCLNTNAPVFADVGYGTFGLSFSDPSQHYTSSPSGTAHYILRAHAAGTPCTGRPIGAVDVPIIDRANQTLIAVGRDARRGVGQQSVPPQLLSCQDAPLAGNAATCTPIDVVAIPGMR